MKDKSIQLEDTVPAPSLRSDPFTITIDGREVSAAPGDLNLVEVASRNRIAIPAPCYRKNRKGGCCFGCVVEANGAQVYACATAPEPGMSVVVKRPDLVDLRKERIAAYAAGEAKGCCESSSPSCCGPAPRSCGC